MQQSVQIARHLIERTHQPIAQGAYSADDHQRDEGGDETATGRATNRQASREFAQNGGHDLQKVKASTRAEAELTLLGF